MRVLLAALGLLALATSASAECAWVLWAEMASAPRQLTSWVAAQAETNKDGCEAVLTAKVKDLARPEPGVKITVKGNFVTRETYRQDQPDVPVAVSITRYVCLPDTVDPRGPKGK